MGIKHRVGLRVQTIRKRRGLTQEQLAERIGRTMESVSALERGKNFPSLATLERLATTLDVPIRDFFDFDQSDATASQKRTVLLAAVTDAVRALDDRQLRIAAAQIDALAEPSRQKR
jgi:transcriptional regulator with XRE-family HTH domain